MNDGSGFWDDLVGEEPVNQPPSQALERKPKRPRAPRRPSTHPADKQPKVVPNPNYNPATIRDLITNKQLAGPQAEAAMAARVGVARLSVVENYAGLSALQRQFLYVRALCESDREAYLNVGVTEKVLNEWQNSPVFCRAYGGLFVDPLSFSVAMMDVLLPKGISVLDKALDSNNLRIALKGVELLMKSKGLLKPNEGDDDENVYERNLAQRLKRQGKPIPPALQKYVIEGDYTVLDRAQ